MADYYSATVIQQTIPEADMTPLERLLLSHIFDAQRLADGWYFCSWEGPSDMIVVERALLEVALAASEAAGEKNSTNAFVKEFLTSEPPGEPPPSHIDLDLSMTSWEWIFQDIVRRSRTLDYVSVVTSFTCSKMRPDGFGGAVVVISADQILGKSTNDLLEEFIAEVAP